MNKKGLTFIEIMISLVIISVSFLGIMATFGAINSAIQSTKSRTLASNLAQEKMQMLKQITYTRLLITPSPSYRTIAGTSVSIPYDNTYYTPETIFEGGIRFTRYTYVQMAQEVNGELQYLGATPDTGMKAVTVTVVWKFGQEEKYIQLRSIFSNPNTLKTNCALQGVVYNAAGFPGTDPINEATVVIAENMSWRDLTAANGTYYISLYDGSYSVYASARGYFTTIIPVSVGKFQTVTQNIPLVAMSSGTVIGHAWTNPFPVISQVVASTRNVSGLEQEYIELFNPTTYWVVMSEYNILYQNEEAASPSVIPLDYKVAGSSIPPGRYYLIANTATVTACGVTKTADAYYSAPNYGGDVIESPDAGGVGLRRISDGVWIDRVGWDRNPGTPKQAPLYETDGIDQVVGFTENEQYIRRTSTSGVTSGYARCYDSGNNNIDFMDVLPMTYPPKNSSDSDTIISGVPSIGAIVSCNDGLSIGTLALRKGNIPWAEFELPEVATGTWTMWVTSGSYTMEITTVTIASHGQRLLAPNSSTGPQWPLANYPAVFLSSETTGGFISGRVINAMGSAISPAITVKAGGVSALASTSNGRYVIAINSGTYSVTANPDNANSFYVSQVADNIQVEIGRVTSGVDFVLAQGGRISGWVTRDKINPLPGISMVASLFETGAVRGQEISGSDGRFTIVNLSTGIYEVAPELESGETSVPSYSTCTVTAGSNVFIGSFTITGAYGKITGTVRSAGRPISTGVLIAASTSSFTTPPTLSSASIISTAYYFTNSYEDGTYSLDVRGSTLTPYYVRAYYPVVTKSSATIYTSLSTGTWVTPGQTTPNINFSW